MPGHAGIKADDRTDSLAKSASVVNGKVKNRADICNAVGDSFRDECSCN